MNKYFLAIMVAAFSLLACGNAKAGWKEEVRVQADTEGQAFVVRGTRSGFTFWTCPSTVILTEKGGQRTVEKKNFRNGICTEGGKRHAEIRREANEVTPEMKEDVMRLLVGREMLAMRGEKLFERRDGTLWHCPTAKLRFEEGRQVPFDPIAFTDGTCTKMEAPTK